MLKLYIDTNLTDCPTVINFLEWISSTENAALKLLSQLVLGYGLAIYVQRTGDKNNDVTASNAGCLNFLIYFMHSSTQYIWR